MCIKTPGFRVPELVNAIDFPKGNEAIVLGRVCVYILGDLTRMNQEEKGEENVY